MSPASSKNPKNALTDMLILLIEPGLGGAPCSWCEHALDVQRATIMEWARHFVILGNDIVIDIRGWTRARTIHFFRRKR